MVGMVMTAAPFVEIKILEFERIVSIKPEKIDFWYYNYP
jgi:hypothetical protein